MNGFSTCRTFSFLFSSTLVSSDTPIPNPVFRPYPTLPQFSGTHSFHCYKIFFFCLPHCLISLQLTLFFSFYRFISIIYTNLCIFHPVLRLAACVLPYSQLYLLLPHSFPVILSSLFSNQLPRQIYFHC